MDIGHAEELIRLIRGSVIGDDEAVQTPFGLRRVTYADYTASGRSLTFIEDYLRDYPKMLDIQGFPTQVVHQSTNPDVAVVEFDAEGVVVATGKPYRFSYIAVITVRNGEIVSYRDYWNPLYVQEMSA